MARFFFGEKGGAGRRLWGRHGSGGWHGGKTTWRLRFFHTKGRKKAATTSDTAHMVEGHRSKPPKKGGGHPVFGEQLWCENRGGRQRGTGLEQTTGGRSTRWRGRPKGGRATQALQTQRYVEKEGKEVNL